jgi:hypothetical protein
MCEGYAKSTCGNCWQRSNWIHGLNGRLQDYVSGYQQSGTVCSQQVFIRFSYDGVFNCLSGMRGGTGRGDGIHGVVRECALGLGLAGDTVGNGVDEGRQRV